MSRSLIRLALLLSCLYLGLGNTLAQSISISSTPSDLTSCGAPDTFAIGLQNLGADTLTGIGIFLQLAPGVAYVSGSANGGGVSHQANPAPDSVFLSSDTIFPFQSLDFTFLAQATCAASDSGTAFNFIRVLHSLGLDSINGAPYAILRPALAIQSIIPSSVTDTLGATYTRCVTFINGGFGSLQDFHAAIVVDTTYLGYSNFTLAANGAPLTPVYSGDSIQLYFDGSHIVHTGDLDSLLEQNETLEICYDVLIKTCGGIGSEIHAYWGCGGEVCESQLQGANTIVDILSPLLVVDETSIRSRCYGGAPSVGKIIVENQGSGRARDVVLNVFGYNGYLVAYDTSSIRWVNSNGNSTSVSPSFTQVGSSSGNLACLGANRIQRFEVTIPEMLPGEIDTLIFDVWGCCKTWCPISPFIVDRTDYTVRYTGRCDTTNYAIQRQVLMGNNYGRVVSMASTGPSDLLPGDTAVFCIEHSNFRFYDRLVGAYAEAEFVLPPSLSYTGLPGDLFFEDPQGDTWMPSSVTVSGDTVRGRFDFPVTSGVTLEKINMKIRLVPNCSGPCDGGPSSISYQLFEVADTSCSCRSLIACFDWAVNIHCGVCNCDDGGMIFRNFEVFRSNLGLPDNDDNGLPDTSGTIDSTQIRMNYVMFGDTLTTVFYGAVDTVTANPYFTGGYAMSRISGGDFLTPIEHTIEIFDQSAASQYTCPLPAPTTTPLAGDTALFTYTFDTTQLSSCLPSGFVFDEGDSVIITNRYRVSGNINSAIRNRSMENYVGLINDISGDTAACDSFGGAFVHVGYYFTNCCFNRWYSSYCNLLTISQNYYLSVGNCCSNYSGGNVFRNEFRHWATMDQVEVVVPFGYTFVSATLQHLSTAGTGVSSSISNIPLTATAFYGDTVLIELDSTWVNAGGVIPLGDDGFYGVLRVTLEPGCQAGDNPDRIYFVYEFEPIPQLTGPGAYTTTRTSYDSLIHHKANLDLAPLLPLVSGLSSTVDWEFSVTNNSNAYISTNSWFSLVSPSGQIVPLTVVNTTTNTVMTPVNGIYQIGDIDPDSVRNFRVTASYGNCDLDSVLLRVGWDCAGYPTAATAIACVMDSAFLFVEPQPSDLQANLIVPTGNFEICDSIPVQLQIVSSQVADVQNIDIDFFMPLTGGLTYRLGSAEMEYPGGSGFLPIPDPVISGTQFSWDVNSINAIIAANDLPGSVQPDSNDFNIRFVLETNCSFTSGERFSVELNGNRPCGDGLTPLRLFSDPININGVSQPYNTTLVATAAENTSCPMNQTIDVALLNTGAGSSSVGDSIFVDLGPGYTYAANFQGGTNAPNPSAPTIQIFASGTRLGWAMPPGLSPGDSVVFSFDVDISSLVSCGNDVATVSSVVNASLFCARTGTNCNAGAQTGSFILNIPIARPDLSFSSFTSTRAQVTGGWEYVYNGTIQNNGVAITGGTPTTVNIFCDTDNSGGYSTGDSLLGSYTTTTALPNGGTHSFGGILNYNNSACADTNAIFAVIFPDTASGYCLCDTAEANTNTVLPVQWLKVAGEAIVKGNLLTWEARTLPGHDYFVVEEQEGGQWRKISEQLRGRGPRFSFLHVIPEALEQYRIKAVDQNGTATYSEIVSLSRPDRLFCELYPNPASNEVFLSGPEGARYRLVDLVGHVVAEGTLDNSVSRVSLEALAAGVYAVEFRFGKQKQVEKLVVEQ